MILLCISSVEAQIVKPQKMAETQAKELEKKTSLTNYLDKTSSSQKQQAKEKAQLLTTYLYKAVLHRSDKTKYPIDNNNKLEKRIAELVADVPEKNYQNANEKIQAALTDASKKQNDLGKYADVVFAGKTLAEQFRAKGEQLQVVKIKKPEMKLAETATVNVLAHLVYCEDETNPETGDDDIILGGLFVSADNKANGNALYCGGFNDGDYAALNDFKIAEAEYSRKENFPQTFYGLLTLMNARADENSAVNSLEDVYAIVVGMLEAEDSQMGENVLSMIASCVEAFTSLFLNSYDLLNPFGIKLEVRSANDIYINDSKVLFINGNLSDTWGTGNIHGHGGTYKIALKLRK